jgi:hypothetical protein
MKIRVTFKTPDALEDALAEACPNKKLNYETDEWEPLSEDEEDERAVRVEEVKKFLQHYIKYGECVTLEFDTETETVTVLETGS